MNVILDDVSLAYPVQYGVRRFVHFLLGWHNEGMLIIGIAGNSVDFAPIHASVFADSNGDHCDTLFLCPLRSRNCVNIVDVGKTVGDDDSEIIIHGAIAVDTSKHVPSGGFNAGGSVRATQGLSERHGIQNALLVRVAIQMEADFRVVAERKDPDACPSACKIKSLDDLSRELHRHIKLLLYRPRCVKDEDDICTSSTSWKIENFK